MSTPQRLDRTSRRTPARSVLSATLAGALGLFLAAACAADLPDPPRGQGGPGRPAAAEPAYPDTFRLPAIAATPVPPLPRPTRKAAGLDAPSYVDPVHGTRVYKVTDAADFPGASHVRHAYSRRQAFNADRSRFLAATSNGYWVLYDAGTFARLKRRGQDGALKGMAADCEAIWHPTDPRKLWYTSPYGGLTWWEKDVATDTDTVMADFRGRLPWPAATSVWTKGEGTSSADGRVFAFMATTYDEARKTNVIHGLFSYDRVADRIIGTLDAKAFGGVFPDHVSVSPSGRFVVPSWAHAPALGTRAYTPDFASFRPLLPDSEHSDLAIGPDGEDLYVAASYRRGQLVATSLATGATFELMRLYPHPGSVIGALHVSGQAFDRPGWVVVSTYADVAEHGRLRPDPVLRPAHRKIMLVELKPGGRRYGVAHTRAGVDYGGYFGEPQATVSRDGTRILFASNFGDGGAVSSYLVLLPDQVYATGAGR